VYQPFVRARAYVSSENQRCCSEGEKNISRVNYEFRALGRKALRFTRRRHHATYFSLYAKWRTRLIGQLRCRSLSPTLDSHHARRACRNGAPILQGLADAKFILVLHHALSLSLPPLALSSLTTTPFFIRSRMCLLRLRVSGRLFPSLSVSNAPQHVSRVSAYPCNVDFPRDSSLNEVDASRYYCARDAARRADRRLRCATTSRIVSFSLSASFQIPDAHPPLSVPTAGENEGEAYSRPLREKNSRETYRALSSPFNLANGVGESREA